MHRRLSFCASALALLAFTFPAHATPDGDRAAAVGSSKQPAVLMAQATAAGAGAAPSSGMPSSDDIGKMKKRAQSKKKPTKAEMEKIKQHVPPEYHQYLNFR